MKSVSVSCASQITSGSLPRAAREGDTSARGEEPQLAGEVASSLHRSFRGSERVPAFQNTRCCSSCCREHLEIPALEVKGAGNNLAPLDFVDNCTNHLTEAPVRVPTEDLILASSLHFSIKAFTGRPLRSSTVAEGLLGSQHPCQSPLGGCLRRPGVPRGA